MVQLSLKQLNDSSFYNAIIRLNNERGMDSTTTYRVGKFAMQADKALRDAAVADEELLKPYIDAGKVKENPDNKLMVWSDDAAQAEYQTKKDALLEKKIEFKIHKLNFGAIKNLTGLELAAIEDILDNVPEA